MKRLKIVITLTVAILILVVYTFSRDYSMLMFGNKSDRAVYHFQRLMDLDRSGNRRAVIWDGEKAHRAIDELDDNRIDDGASLRAYEPFENEKYTLNIYGLENRREVISTDDHLLFEANDASWFFELQTIDSYEDKVEELKGDRWLYLIGDDNVGYTERRALFRGISTYNDKNYAGYTVVYDDGCDNYCVITYMVIGNMNDAGTMINQLVDQLIIIFDKDAWIEEKTRENNGDD